MKEQQPATLTAKQERFCLHLSAGMAIKAAAAEVGAGERTVHEWLARPDVKARVAELREQLLSEAIGKLSNSVNRAALVLDELLDVEDERIKLRAAVAVLNVLIKVREHKELAERVAELEAHAEDNGRHRR